MFSARPLLRTCAIGIAVALPTWAAPQGSDDCSTPAAISGEGSFSYDTTSATGSGFNGSLVSCYSTQDSNPADHDVFFVWNAPCDGNFTVHSCGDGYDNIIAVHAGNDCSATCVAGADTSSVACNTLDAEVFWLASAGQDYLIQVGSFAPADGGGAGSIQLSIVAATHPNDTCATPAVIAGIGSFPFDSTGACTSGFTGAASGCPVGTTTSDVFFLWTDAVGGDFEFEISGSDTLSDLTVYAGADCSATCIREFTSASVDSRVLVPGIVASGPYLVQVGSWLFNPGGYAGTLTIGPAPQPSNDDCASPAVITGFGTFAFDSTGCTDSGFFGGDAVTCGDTQNGNAPGRDLFYLWTAPCDDTVTVHNCNDGFDSTINVHLGSDCSATCIEGNDGATVNCSTTISSEVTWAVTGSSSYLIQIGNWSDTAPANFSSFEISSGTGSCPVPTNDDCSSPLVIAGTGTFAFNNNGSTDSGFQGGDPVVCGDTEMGDAPTSDLFFVWTAPCDAAVTVHNCGADFDSSINIHLGSDCSATCIDGNDGATVQCSGVNESEVIWSATTGQDYLIQIGAWSSVGPIYAIHSFEVQFTPALANDTCATPTPLTGFGTTLFDNTGGCTENFQGAAAGCSTGTFAADVFFVWSNTVGGDVRFDTSASSDLTDLAVYLGADCSATCIAEFTSGGTSSWIDVLGVQASTSYLIQVGAWDSAGTGIAGQLDIGPVPGTPANDNCSNPTPISGIGLFPVDSSGATTSGFDGSDPAVCGASGQGAPPFQDVFFVWTAPCDGDYTVTDCGIPADTAMNLHLGSDCSAVCITGDGDGSVICGGLNVDLTWTAAEDADYLIQIGHWSDGEISGDLEILLNTTPCPADGITVSCDPNSDHYAGDYVKLGTSSFGSGVGSGLHLEATDGPDGEFGFFIVSASATSTIPVFNGILCLDALTARYNSQVASNQGLPQLNSIGQFDEFGVLQSLVGNAPSTGGSGFDVPTELPFSPVGMVIAPGESWSFQLWYRDQLPPLPNPGSTANWSNVVTAQF